ncbi:MAG: two-component system, sensor protein [Rhodoglobus sp.]|nr:two-component system, sensor protein [Rhodoglobus sp.]
MADSVTAPKTVPQGKQLRNPISRKQVENVISRSVGVFGIVFGAQTVPWLLGQLDEPYSIWLWIIVPAMFGSLVVAVVCSFAKRWVRPAHGLVSIVYLIAIITWPFMIRPDAEIFSGIHWLYYLLTVATATAAIAFNTALATVYLFVAPLIYMVVRATPLGGAAPLGLAVLETIYSIILGGAVMIIVTMLRSAASSVDNAQATALDRYSHAVRQHATEVERVQVDSIVHDSVLTTFISAARAFTPQAQELAATMAGNAIGYLRDAAAASPDDGTTVRFATLAERITDAAAALSSPFELRVKSVGTRSLPVQAAEAIYSAAVQAMVNSLQHAGEDDVKRWVAVRGISPGGLEVVVGDTGAGFELVEVPNERLGVRVSIIERIANAGGRAVIQSAPGEGTIVSIRWPHAAAPAAPTFEVAVQEEVR